MLLTSAAEDDKLTDALKQIEDLQKELGDTKTSYDNKVSLIRVKNMYSFPSRSRKWKVNYLLLRNPI